MRVENKIVYRIVPFDLDIKIGEYAQPTKWEIKGDFKRRLEESLEKQRPNGMPPRDKCLYVCFSKENAYEWASIKFGRQTTSYKLLTLELNGDLFWLKADCYNFLPPNCSIETIENASIDYWNSNIEVESLLAIDKSYEGLFIGENKITAIEYKNYINGESVDID